MLRSIFMYWISTLILLAAAELQAQQEINREEISISGQQWSIEAMGESNQIEHLGRQALFLERAQMTLQEQGFSEGVIDFSLAAEQASGFVGVNFRDDGNGTGEQFYVRFHQSERPDSTQYLARLNGLASWQLHAGPNDATAVRLDTGEWIDIRIVVQGDRADIFVRDMETPLLHVPDLRSDNKDGHVTFYAYDRPGMITGAYFSNLVIRPLAEDEGVIGVPKPEAEVATTVFRQWQISSPISEASLVDSFTLDSVDRAALQWRKADVERNGILNISRFTRKTADADTVLLSLKIHTGEDTSRLFRFGYSDRVRIYVNGVQQFYGNAQWRSRDHRFLGTVGLHDAIPLHLKAGENEVIAAISESFGGWGFIGQIEDRHGLSCP